MAASLIRIGQLRTLRTLQQEAWGLPCISSSATAFSTKSTDPKKGRSKNVVTPVERAKLQVSKQEVKVPKKSSAPHPPASSTGEAIASTKSDEVFKITDEERGQFLSKKTSVEFPPRVPSLSVPLNKELQVPLYSPEERVNLLAFKSFIEFPKHKPWSLLTVGTSMAKEQQDHKVADSVVGGASIGVPGKGEDKKFVDEGESSSSSDSDSTSDSDSDFEETVAGIAVKTKVEFPKQASFSVKQSSLNDKVLKQSHAEELLTKKRGAPASELPLKLGETVSRSSRQMEPHEKTTLVDETELVERSVVSKEKEMQTGHGVFDLQTKERDAVSRISLETTSEETDQLFEQISHSQAKSQQVCDAGPEAEQTLSTKEQSVPQETLGVVEGSLTKTVEKVLEDEVATIKADAEKETISEEALQLPTEDIPQVPDAAPVSTQEEFDISTYKNLQHHSYTPFTFVDFELDLSKFRQPQPSSGRLSPRD